MAGNNSKSGSIEFMGLLTIVFIALKLTGYITWPWWLVLAPLWGSIAFWLAIVVIGFIILGVISWYEDHSKRKRIERISKR
jgi:predicted tellurium resistance membrane protein TerC